MSPGGRCCPFEFARLCCGCRWKCGAATPFSHRRRPQGGGPRLLTLDTITAEGAAAPSARQREAWADGGGEGANGGSSVTWEELLDLGSAPQEDVEEEEEAEGRERRREGARGRSFRRDSAPSSWSPPEDRAGPSSGRAASPRRAPAVPFAGPRFADEAGPRTRRGGRDSGDGDGGRGRRPGRSGARASVWARGVQREPLPERGSSERQRSASRPRGFPEEDWAAGAGRSEREGKRPAGRGGGAGSSRRPLFGGGGESGGADGQDTERT